MNESIKALSNIWNTINTRVTYNLSILDNPNPDADIKQLEIEVNAFREVQRMIKNEIERIVLCTRETDFGFNFASECLFYRKELDPNTHKTVFTLCTHFESSACNPTKDDCAKCKYRKTIQEFSDDYIF